VAAVNAEVADLVAVENTVTLFGSNDPSAVVVRATAVSKPLANVIKDRKLFASINGRRHVTVEGWTLLGTMLGVFPVVIWSRAIENGWEARVEARTLQGEVVGAAESQCTRLEKTWKTRDDYALRSMAQTRATSKALRLPLGFVMAIAGYDATPLEEMVSDVPPLGPQSGAHTRDEQPPDSKATAAVAREGNDKAPEESGGGIGSAAGPSAPSKVQAVKALRDALQQLHPGNVVWRQREKQICLDHNVDSLEQIDELKLQTETHNVLSKVKP
jgi:hypothetical protein